MRRLFTDFTLADRLVFLAASLLVLGSYVVFWHSEPASMAIVRTSADEVIELDLHDNRRITVSGKLGDSILQVKDGRLRFVDSPCTNKLCIHSGWHSHGGEVTACLPNRVLVQLAASGEPAYDAINF